VEMNSVRIDIDSQGGLYAKNEVTNYVVRGEHLDVMKEVKKL
jgi:hypothetical protein